MNDNVKMILGAIIMFVITWVVLSLILQWAKPSMVYTNNSNVNWWTTLWITLVTLIIVWIVLLILHLLTGGSFRSKSYADCAPDCVDGQQQMQQMQQQQLQQQQMQQQQLQYQQQMQQLQQHLGQSERPW